MPNWVLNKVRINKKPSKVFKRIIRKDENGEMNFLKKERENHGYVF